MLMEEIQSTPRSISHPSTSLRAEVPMQCTVMGQPHRIGANCCDVFPFIKMIGLCVEIGTASSHEDIHPPRNNNNRLPAFCLDCQMNERFADSHKQGRAAPFLVPTQQVPPPLHRGLQITIWKLEFRRDTLDCFDIIDIIKYSEGRGGGVSRTKQKEFLPARCMQLGAKTG